jgi:hypothetical protein
LGLGKASIGCKIWDRKEIENYCLCETSIVRAVQSRLSAIGLSRTPQEIRTDLLRLTEQHGRYVEQQLEIHAKESSSPEVSRVAAKTRFKLWDALEGRFQIGPGKQIVSDICGHYKAKFNISLSLSALIDAMHPEELAADLIDTLSELDKFCTDEVSATIDAMG